LSIWQSVRVILKFIVAYHASNKCLIRCRALHFFALTQRLVNIDSGFSKLFYVSIWARR